MKIRLLITLFAVLFAVSAYAQQQDYYLTDGDSETMFIVRDGQLQDSVTTFNLGYPIAIMDSVLLYHRDAVEGREYDLSGNPTGFTWTGPGGYSEILDGTTDGVQYNYMVMCCASGDGDNYVLRSDLQFENLEVLFTFDEADFPDGGAGIVYDPVGGQLFITAFDNQIYRFSLTGDVLEQFTIDSASGALCCLAYEQETDTFWAARNSSDMLYQFDRQGNTLDSVAVDGLESFGNIWGGGMQITGTDAPPPLAVDTLSWQSLMLLLLAMAAIGWFSPAMRR